MAGSLDVGVKIPPMGVLAFLCNMAIGIGSMSLPKKIQEVGFALGGLFMITLAVFAYIAATFVVEAQSICNALFSKDKNLSASSPEEETLLINAEEGPLADNFNISRRVEYTKIAEVLFPKALRGFFILIFLGYFLGDLVIYACGVPRVFKQMFGETVTVYGHELTGMTLHRVVIVLFACIVTPLTLFDYQKTRVLQYITLGMRFTAYYTMITIGVIFLFEGNGTKWEDVPVFNWKKLPYLFGGVTYSMMTHHSLPSILTPIKDQAKTFSVLKMAYAIMPISYILLTSTAVLSFSDPSLPEHCSNESGVACKIQDLYLLNFASYDFRIIAWGLLIFPFFIFTTLYPLIVMTLRNNLEQFLPFSPGSKLRRPVALFFSLIVPFLIAFTTSDFGHVMHLTGVLCGSFIMLAFPTLFAIYGRRLAKKHFPNTWMKNSMASKFQSGFWIFLVSFFFITVFSVSTTMELKDLFFKK
ncbi:hypothetical protein RCL1_000086 [Eukaryota sp. TZLM3-RCL]